MGNLPGATFALPSVEAGDFPLSFAHFYTSLKVVALILMCFALADAKFQLNLA